MQKPLISVIIPVYNVEPYLHQCLDSVLSSTHTNLQVILVNDGSPDNCGSICDAYADRDQRVMVIHKENEGLSEARNSGLAVAKGEYVAFVDSDDIVSSTLFATLLWAIELTNADISACEHTRTDEQMAFLSPPPADCLKVIDGVDRCLQVFSGEPSTRAITWTDPMVWNKLYRKEKIISTFKKECVPAEDMQFNWEYAKNCNKMVIVPQALYYWRINADSITHTPNVNKYVTIARVWSGIAQRTDTANACLQAHLYYRAAYSAHEGMWRIIDADSVSEYQEFFGEARTVINQYFREFTTHEDTTYLTGIVYTLCRYCFSIWKRLPKAYRYLKKVCK